MQVSEVGEELIALGREVFTDPSHFPRGVPRYNVLSWLFSHCVEAGLRIEPTEREAIVERVHASANSVIHCAGGHGLTVEQLRALIASLPENLPVVYQRIEDRYFTEHNWTAVKLPWESRPASAADIAHLRDHHYGDTALVEKDGKMLVRDTTDCIAAFGAYLATDDDGNRALVIHAHY